METWVIVLVDIRSWCSIILKDYEYTVSLTNIYIFLLIKPFIWRRHALFSTCLYVPIVSWQEKKHSVDFFFLIMETIMLKCRLKRVFFVLYDATSSLGAEIKILFALTIIHVVIGDFVSIMLQPYRFDNF